MNQLSKKTSDRGQYDIVGKPEGKNWPQALGISIACISSLHFGMVAAWTSPYMLKISEDKVHYDISEKQAATLTIISPITMMVSCLFFHNLNDRIGRKTTLMLMAVPNIVANILNAFARKIFLFYLARIFVGLGDTVFHVTLTMYIAEMATPKVRGTWGCLEVHSCFFGIFLMNVIGSFLTVIQTSYVCLTIMILFLLLMLAIPESPYYFIMKDRKEEALRSLRFLRASENVYEEYETLKTDVKRQIAERGTWKDLVGIPANRKALLAGIFLRTSQLSSGCIVLNNYVQFIFNKSGTNISAELSSMIYTGISFLQSVVCVYFVSKFSRKMNYMFSMLICSLIHLSLALFFFLDQNLRIDLKSIQWFPLLGMILYIVFSFGIVLVPPIMIGELFSVIIKTKALTVLTIFSGVMQFGLNKIFYEFYSNFGLFAPFLLFSLCCFISTVLSLRILPETKGMTLGEIQQLLRQENINSEEI